MVKAMTVNIGKGLEMDVPDFGSLTPEVQAHIAYIGWRNILMDAHAGVKAEEGPEASRAMSQKKLDALLRGEVRTAAFREGDPVKAEAMRLAIAAIKAALKKAGRKAEDKDIREKAKSILDKFMAKARENVEAARGADIDLGDL